ncbi:MAG: DUF3617 domain-containing protein [Burkholderiales bacterium]
MLKRVFPCLLALLCAPCAGAALDPGEWEFVATTTSRLLPGPQHASFRRCIRKEEAENPDRWMSDPGQQGDCKIIPGPKAGLTYTWQMECPQSKMRGAGSARLDRAMMEGETTMTGEIQGQKFELRTRVTGKRLGPCK